MTLSSPKAMRGSIEYLNIRLLEIYDMTDLFKKRLINLYGYNNPIMLPLNCQQVF